MGHVSYPQRECVDLNSPKRWTLQDLPTRGHPQSRLLLVAIVLPLAIVLRNITAGRVRQQPCGVEPKLAGVRRHKQYRWHVQQDDCTVKRVKCAVKDTAVVELDSRGHNTWTAQAASCQNGVTPRSDRMVRGDEPNDSPASWQTMRTVMFSSGTALSTNVDATSRPECGWALAGRCSCVRCCGENSLSLPRRCRTSRPALANSVVVSIPPPPSATAAIVSSSTVALQPHVLSLLMSSRLARASRETERASLPRLVQALVHVVPARSNKCFRFIY